MELREYMRVVDAAKQLAVTPRQVRKLIGQGALKATQVSPRLYLIERSSVNDYQNRRRPAGRPPRDPFGSASFSMRPNGGDT
jgi:excisionase family DNA binding protein